MNDYFYTPYGYPPAYVPPAPRTVPQQPAQMPMQQPAAPRENYAPAPVDDRIFVPNEAAADAYLLAPNSFARLWDSSRPRFYEKQTDASGRQLPMQIYEYAPMGRASEQAANDIDQRIKALEERLAAIEERKPGRKKAEADE